MTRARLLAIERICRVHPGTSAAYSEWKRLVSAHSITGVSVHDARIAAQMAVWRIGTIVTMNASDFRRYPGIVVQTPAELLAAGTGQAGP